jgi:hypothetical protein
VAAKTDMKEQIQLKIDLNQDNGSPAPSEKKGDEGPQLNFSTDSDKKDTAPSAPPAPAKDGQKKEEGDIQLNFSTDTDKK